MNKRYLFSIVLCLMALPYLQGQKSQYFKKDLVADLQFLKTELEAYHTNLYTYQSKVSIDAWFENTMANINPTISAKDAYKLICSISEVIKDGHAYIYPSSSHLDSFFNHALLFPLDVFSSPSGLKVVGNHSLEQNIPLGATLLRINGQSIEDIQNLIVSHTCRDGHNLEYPKHIFYQFFPAYYSFFYGFKKSYTIHYLDEKGIRNEAQVNGLTRQQMSANKTQEREKAIKLNILPDSQSAILVIQSFDNKILKDDYQQSFKKAVKSAFKQLEDLDINHLAIDLRNNQGGALSNGIYLLKHFMDQKFQCVNSYYILKKGKLKKLTSHWDDYFKPHRKHHYKGEVCIFQNGGSFSCSSIVANTFQQYNKGPIIGTMSGGSAFVNSGAPNKEITLPNTQIIFTIPRTQYNLRNAGSPIEQGVLPDIEVQDDHRRVLGLTDPYIDAFYAHYKIPRLNDYE